MLVAQNDETLCFARFRNKYFAFLLTEQGFALNPSVLHSQAGKGPALLAALRGWGKRIREKKSPKSESLQHSFSFHPAQMGISAGLQEVRPPSTPCSSSKLWNLNKNLKAGGWGHPAAPQACGGAQGCPKPAPRAVTRDLSSDSSSQCPHCGHSVLLSYGHTQW